MLSRAISRTLTSLHIPVTSNIFLEEEKKRYLGNSIRGVFVTLILPGVHVKDTSLQTGFDTLLRTTKNNVNFILQKGAHSNKNPSLGGGQYRTCGSNAKSELALYCIVILYAKF